LPTLHNESRKAMNGHLFPDRAIEIDQYIASLLVGESGGPFGLRLQPEEKAVLQAVRYHRGAANAVPIRELTQRLKMNERQVKLIVRTLRISFRLPIGSSKHGIEGGYFIIITPEDQAVFLKGPLDQIRAELEVVRAVAGHQSALELLGQLQLETKQ
jgi:hypothetical protein